MPVRLVKIMQIAGVTQPADTLSCYEAGAAQIASAMLLPQTGIMGIPFLWQGYGKKAFNRPSTNKNLRKILVAEEGLEPPTRGGRSVNPSPALTSSL